LNKFAQASHNQLTASSAEYLRRLTRYGNVGGKSVSRLRPVMAELVNLRSVRKRAKRRADDQRAASSRLTHGQPKSQRKLQAAQRQKAKQNLDRHLIDKGDGR
jgi:hypothetical protein